eukprot:COSAG02_NODE_2371_length_9032_cov_26.076122_5_plen_191_part_00
MTIDDEVLLGWISDSARYLRASKCGNTGFHLQFADVLDVSSQERPRVLCVVIHAKRVAIDALQLCQIAGQDLAWDSFYDYEKLCSCTSEICKCVSVRRPTWRLPSNLLLACVEKLSWALITPSRGRGYNKAIRATVLNGLVERCNHIFSQPLRNPSADQANWFELLRPSASSVILLVLTCSDTILVLGLR